MADAAGAAGRPSDAPAGRGGDERDECFCLVKVFAFDSSEDVGSGDDGLLHPAHGSVRQLPAVPAAPAQTAVTRPMTHSEAASCYPSLNNIRPNEHFRTYRAVICVILVGSQTLQQLLELFELESFLSDFLLFFLDGPLQIGPRKRPGSCSADRRHDWGLSIGGPQPKSMLIYARLLASGNLAGSTQLSLEANELRAQLLHLSFVSQCEKEHRLDGIVARL